MQDDDTIKTALVETQKEENINVCFMYYIKSSHPLLPGYFYSEENRLFFLIHI